MDEKDRTNTTAAFQCPRWLREEGKRIAGDHGISLSLMLRWYLLALHEGRAPVYPPPTVKLDGT